MEVNGMWSIVNIEKTLSPPPPLPPFPTQFHASFPAPFQSTICSPPRSPLPSPFRSTLRSPLRSLFYSVHCRLKKTKFYRLITLENYWTCRTTLTSYRCARLSANSSQQYTSLNYYTKQLVFSRRSRTRAQSNERSGARMKTENETGEELFLSPSWFWENWQTDQKNWLCTTYLWFLLSATGKPSFSTSNERRSLSIPKMQHHHPGIVRA